MSQFHNLTAQATYTWSKCTDYGSSTQAPTTYQNSLPGLTYYNKTQRKGACDYDLPQNFSANLLYELQTHFSKGLVNTLTSGFQVGAIVFREQRRPLYGHRKWRRGTPGRFDVCVVPRFHARLQSLQSQF